MDRQTRTQKAGHSPFARILLANLDAALELLRILLMPDSASRLAAGLLRAARSRANPIPITQAEIAAITNTSARQASATLRRFEAEGLISLGYRRITLLDPEGLRAMVYERTD